MNERMKSIRTALKTYRHNSACVKAWREFADDEERAAAHEKEGARRADRLERVAYWRGCIAQVAASVERVERLLARLPDDTRALLLSHYVNGLSWGEVGAASGRSQEAARQKAWRAIRALSAN